MAEEIVKKKRTRKDSSLESGDTQPGDNAKFTRHKLEIISWGDIVISDPVAVRERSVKYIQSCVDHDLKPTIAGYALALGMERHTLFRYREGQLGKNDEVRNTLKKTCVLINSLMEDYMQNGKINPVAGIFLMKNNMNYTDKQEVVVTPKQQPLGELEDAESIEKKYLADLEGGKIVESGSD